VKTISQPKITMLSGASATLRAVDTVNYVSSLERTINQVDGGDDDISLSTQTDSVDSGFTLTIASNWDNASVYSNIEIELDQLQDFDNFDTGIDGDSISLPITTERDLSTQVRIRPGDSLLIAGLVRETDQYSNEGPGLIKPLFSTSRSTNVENVELVFLLKPRVIVYTSDYEEEARVERIKEQVRTRIGPEETPAAAAPANPDFENVLQKVNRGQLVDMPLPGDEAAADSAGQAVRLTDAPKPYIRPNAVAPAEDTVPAPEAVPNTVEPLEPPPAATAPTPAPVAATAAENISRPVLMAPPVIPPAAQDSPFSPSSEEDSSETANPSPAKGSLPLNLLDPNGS
jgi:hypothetical protein